MIRMGRRVMRTGFVTTVLAFLSITAAVAGTVVHYLSPGTNHFTDTAQHSFTDSSGTTSWSFVSTQAIYQHAIRDATFTETGLLNGWVSNASKSVTYGPLSIIDPDGPGQTEYRYLDAWCRDIQKTTVLNFFPNLRVQWTNGYSPYTMMRTYYDGCPSAMGVGTFNAIYDSN